MTAVLRGTAPIIALMFVFTFLFGLTAGAGAAADGELEAPQIDVDGEVAETRAEMLAGAIERDNQFVPDVLEEPVTRVQVLPEWAVEEWRQAITAGVVGFMAVALHLGNVGIIVGFELSRVVPPTAVSAIATGFSYLSLGGLLISKLLEARRLVAG